MRTEGAYEPDRSLVGKVRRRLVRLYQRRPARGADRRPLLSISFDDAPATATTTGAEILEARGLKGTYFIAADLLGTEGPMGPYAGWNDVERLHRAGHEIGCHTRAHLDCGKASGAESIDDVAGNLVALAAHGIAAPQTFAWPYGDVAPGPKAVLAPRFALLRALHNGLVERRADLNQAPSIGIEGKNGESKARMWIQRAAKRKAWVILTTHDVAPCPSPWGCTPETLGRLIDEALALGFEVVTVAQGAKLLA
jgi:peptidoglycan/xylan/chitin deacetylase (PgdA/CDA1 family)